MSIKYEPDYECYTCGIGMDRKSIRHMHTPQDNSAPVYFCSIGCYYSWAEGADTHGESSYDDNSL